MSGRAARVVQFLRAVAACCWRVVGARAAGPGEQGSTRWWSRFRDVFRVGLRVFVITAVGCLIAAGAFIASPLPPGLTDYRAATSIKVFDRHGRLLRELLSRDDGRSTPLRREALSPHVEAAFLSAEDHRFRQHPGVDAIAIARAALANVRAGMVVAGGSTITQQLARTLIPRQRTLWGKAKEALWAIRLETHLSKDEILMQYLNRISFGNGTVGLEAASQLYFGVHAKDLSTSQAASLA